MLSLNFRTKTNIALALVLLALASIGLVSLRETSQLVRGEERVAHSREVLETSASMSSHLSDAIAARRGYLLSGNPQQPDIFAKASQATLTDLKYLGRITADNSTQQERLAALEPLIRNRLETLSQSIELHRTSGSDADREAQAVMSKHGSELADQISELFRGFHDTESELLVQRMDAAAATVRLTFQVETALAVSFFGVLIAALTFINRELSLRERAERALAEHDRLLRSVLDSSSDLILVSDRQGKIILRNSVAARYHENVPPNVRPEEWPQGFGLFQSDKKTPFSADQLPLARAALHGESVDNVEVYVRPPGWESGRWHLASSRPLPDESGQPQGGIVVLRDITERRIAEEERDRLIVELYKSLANVKTLAGLLPICAGCKKIRDDKGYWTQVEDYISKHSDVTFSHGLCPQCVSRLYPEVAEKKNIP
ncbi:MAG: CHASE3 domain-containing protein [Acidobacteriia bacterium]|nr:CHASE3 domain-containing protein [Terriglobia bacterium]